MKKTMLVAVVSAFVGGFATQAFADKQPMMRAALGNLQQAKANLEKATTDKGGHRVKALALVNEAIEQVQKGIEFDNRN
jgi:hypothetical protein